MKICYFGDYDPEYSRNNVVMKGLRKNGVDVIPCQVPTSFRRKYYMLWKKHRALRGQYDVLVVGYSISRFMAVFAKLVSEKRVVWNPLFSLYDSWVLDRKLVSKWHPKAWYYFFLDWVACVAADGILLDTNQSIDFFCRSFHVRKDKFKRIFVGTDEEVFYPREKKRNEEDTFSVSFHGGFIPFHGVRYIIEAAEVLQKENIRFTIIGFGQTYKQDRQLAESLAVKNIEFVPPVSYRELAEQIASADLCLGVFGNIERVNRVIPNKIFEAVASGIPVLTASSTAVKELFADGESIMFCNSMDAKDLAQKIVLLKENKELRRKIAESALAVYCEQASIKKIGAEVKEYLEKFVELRTRLT